MFTNPATSWLLRTSFCYWVTAFARFCGYDCWRQRPRSWQSPTTPASRRHCGRPITWNIVFATINLFQSWRLYLESRPIQLTADEEDARRLAFPELPARKVFQILNIGIWTTDEAGDRLIEHGKHIDTVSLIIRGRVRVSRDERVVVELVAGDIDGSTLLMTGAPADVDAVVVESTRALRWEIVSLERYLTANPDARVTMFSHLSREFAGKLGVLSKTR